MDILARVRRLNRRRHEAHGRLRDRLAGTRLANRHAEIFEAVESYVATTDVEKKGTNAAAKEIVHGFGWETLLMAIAIKAIEALLEWLIDQRADQK